MSSSDKIDTSVQGNEANPATTVPESKGKGKAVDITPQDISMDEEDSSESETGAEEEAPEELLEEDDEDNMEEIDTSNIINDGRRTRGKTIDYAKAAAEDKDLPDDEDDDDDFEGEQDDDAMQE